MRIPRTLIIPLLAITACVLWSTAFVAIKIGLNFSRPLSFAGMRFIIAGIILMPFCGGITRYFTTVISHVKIILFLSFFQTFLLYGLFYMGMTMVSGAVGAIVVGSSPLFTAIIAHYCMTDDRMTVYQTASIMSGIIGVCVISMSRQPWLSSGWREFTGILILILGNMSCAIGNVIVAKDRQNINPLILNSSQIFLGGGFLFLISLPLEGMPNFVYPLKFYLVLLWLAVISAAAFSLWFVLLKRPEVKVSELNIWKFIIPVSGATLSWIMLPGESPNRMLVIGMIFIALSIVISNLLLYIHTKRKTHFNNTVLKIT